MNLYHEAAERYPVNLPTGPDRLAWAKRLHWRSENGDNTLTHIQVQFARQALGLDPQGGKR
jgi:hypothetical protein